MSGRTASFGVGKRPDYLVHRESPARTSYKPPSDFDFNPKKGKVCTFGKVRSRRQSKTIQGPGPGAYEVRDVPGKNALKCTLSPRCLSPCITTLPLTLQAFRPRTRHRGRAPTIPQVQ